MNQVREMFASGSRIQSGIIVQFALLNSQFFRFKKRGAGKSPWVLSRFLVAFVLTAKGKIVFLSDMSEKPCRAVFVEKAIWRLTVPRLLSQ